MREVDGNTKLLGLMGYPVEHTYSPQMHNYLSERYGLNYVYMALNTPPNLLKDAVYGLRALGFSGVNVTAPHKIEIMTYLDEIDEAARLYGSVNTVKNQDGKLIGYNADADGFYMSLLTEGVDVVGKDLLILGAGGASRPICVKFSKLGAKSITVLNRTQSRAEELAEFIKENCGYHIMTRREHSRYDVVINTTSAGMEPDINSCPIEDFSFIDQDTAVADMIYNPPETVFLRRAKEHGARITINGLGMLIYQGIIAYEIFTGIKIEKSTYADLYKDICREVFGL